jgi:hypothetical protein
MRMSAVLFLLAIRNIDASRSRVTLTIDCRRAVLAFSVLCS